MMAFLNLWSAKKMTTIIVVKVIVKISFPDLLLVKKRTIIYFDEENPTFKFEKHSFYVLKFLIENLKKKVHSPRYS